MVIILLKQGHIFAFSDGTEIAASTLMEILLMNDFKLVIDIFQHIICSCTQYILAG